MKGYLYPKFRKLMCTFQASKLLLIFFSFISSLQVSAHTVIIGSGSGGFSQNSMGTLGSGDTLAVQAGNYTGSIGLQGLTNITVIPYGGNVVISGGNAWQLNSLTNVNITSFKGYSFQFTNCSNDAFYLGSACTGLFFNDIQCNNVQGIFLNASSSGSPYVYYNGTQASLILYNSSITNCKFTGCQMIFQGDYTAPSNLRNFVDSLVFAYDTVIQTATNGLNISGNITRLSVHHNLITYTGLNPQSDDVGFAYFNGWGYFYNNIYAGGRGYLARDFLYSLASNPGTTLMFNNLKHDTYKYGMFDMRCDNTAYGSYCTGANFKIFNNTILNCTDTDFIAPLVVVYQMNAGAVGSVYNNFGANLTFTSGGSFITSFDNWTTDTAGNLYTQNTALSYLKDTSSTFMPTSTSYLNNNGVAEPLASPDLYGFTGTGNRIGAIFYNSGAKPPTSVTANAGSAQTITLPTNTTSLNGSASKAVNSTISTYTWTQTSGPGIAVLSAATSANTNASSLIQGTYVFSLKVKDQAGDSSTASVTIIVNPQTSITPPVANAGASQTITLPANSVSLSGSSSSGGSSTITSYTWAQVSGPNTASLSSTNTVSTNATGLIQGVYVFSLKIKVASGDSASATVSVTVNSPASVPPVVSAGLSQTITLPVNTVNLLGSAIDSIGTIASYAWAQNSGPSAATIANPSSLSTAVTGLVAGTYIFKLTVINTSSQSSSATVTIIVNPAAIQPPVANAGANLTITLPQDTVTVNGSASSDANGTITAYNWSKISGPAQGTIVSPSGITTLLNNLVQGTYTFKLTVTNNAGGSSSDTVAVTVNPALLPPVANAGASQTITLPVNTAILNGSGSSDPSGTFVSYSWTEVSGPSTLTISNANSVSASVSALVAGQYVFLLTITDNNGNSASAQTKVIVNTAPIQPPVANAGASQTITLPLNSVTLDGSASSDPNGTITAYNWSKIAGPSQATILTPTGVTTLVNNLVQGTYIFKLTVTNNVGATSSDTVSVTVNPAILLPVANAGRSITITLPLDSTTLNGTRSYAPSGQIVSYTWSEVSGPSSATLSNSNAVNTTVSALVAGQYVFSLTVTDNNGNSASSQVKVTVIATANLNPIANAGANQTITLPLDSVTLNGSASYAPGGSISSYNWSKISGPAQGTIQQSTADSTVVSYLVQGTYTFQLMVTSNTGATAFDTVLVIVNPALLPPVANAGASQTITLPTNTASLNGSLSSDPDGTIISYTWTEVSGPSSIAISGANSPNASVAALVAGQYVFSLTVKDNHGKSSTAQTKVIVNPALVVPPVANAGANQTITLPLDSVNLNGSASLDANGTITGYSWSKTSGPTQGNILSPTAVSTRVTNLVQGTYTFTLTVTNNNGQTSTDNVEVIVNAPILPPVANAGASQTITLPTNQVSLNGSQSSDPDGTIVSYIWVEVSGPSTATITNNNSSTPTVSSLVSGQYVFSLTVKDNNGKSATAQVKVIVNPAPVQPPVANAGSNQNITLPLDSVSLNGSLSYIATGSIISYSWQKISGPGAFTIRSANKSITEVTALQAGTYVFQLTVVGSNHISASSSVTVTVNPAVVVSYQPPVANAGKDTTLAFPANSLVLSGIASTDPDGNIVSYQWTQVSGPGNAIIDNPDGDTTTASSLETGVYIFQLKVTDNHGMSATDTVQVTIVNNLRTSSATSMLLYPNPAQSTINLRLINDSTGNMVVNILDMMGRIIKTKQINKSQNLLQEAFNISILPKGVYTMQVVMGENAAVVGKFIKQ